MDGYPDLLITVTAGGTRKTWVLYNVVTGDSSARAFGTKAPADLFLDINAAINDTDSYYAAFFDFDEAG